MAQPGMQPLENNIEHWAEKAGSSVQRTYRSRQNLEGGMTVGTVLTGTGEATAGKLH